MRKKFVVSMIIVILFFKADVFVAYANHGVTVRIEGKHSTIASADIRAYTFMEAIENIARQENLQIAMVSKDSGTEIIAINGLQTDPENPFEGWFGYVIRDHTIMQPANISQFTLLQNDEVVLYFGPVNAKKILLQYEIMENTLAIQAQTDFVHWDYSVLPPIVKMVHEYIAGINVHVRYPNKTEQILKTDQNGKSHFDISHPGAYVFFAEGYQSGVETVKTKEIQLILGVKNVKAITRGEFISMFVHALEKDPLVYDSVSGRPFSDSAQYTYSKEIQLAKNLGVVSGYPDGTFKPDNPITLVEAVQILSVQSGAEYDMFTNEKPYVKTLSDWGNKGIAFAYYKNILIDEESDYFRTISLEEAEKMLERWRR